MRVLVDFPEFPEDEHRVLRIMTGIEERARKYPGKPWQIKTVPCNQCGKCCHNVANGWKMGKDPETGHCAHLKYNEGWDNGTTSMGWLCDLGSMRPHSCSVGDEHEKDYCCVQWRKEDGL